MANEEETPITPEIPESLAVAEGGKDKLALEEQLVILLLNIIQYTAEKLPEVQRDQTIDRLALTNTEAAKAKLEKILREIAEVEVESSDSFTELDTQVSNIISVLKAIDSDGQPIKDKLPKNSNRTEYSQIIELIADACEAFLDSQQKNTVGVQTFLEKISNIHSKVIQLNESLSALDPDNTISINTGLANKTFETKKQELQEQVARKQALVLLYSYSSVIEIISHFDPSKTNLLPLFYASKEAIQTEYTPQKEASLSESSVLLSNSQDAASSSIEVWMTNFFAAIDSALPAELKIDPEKRRKIAQETVAQVIKKTQQELTAHFEADNELKKSEAGFKTYVAGQLGLEQNHWLVNTIVFNYREFCKAEVAKMRRIEVTSSVIEELRDKVKNQETLLQQELEEKLAKLRTSKFTDSLNSIALFYKQFNRNQSEMPELNVENQQLVELMLKYAEDSVEAGSELIKVPSITKIESAETHRFIHWLRSCAKFDQNSVSEWERKKEKQEKQLASIDDNIKRLKAGEEISGSKDKNDRRTPEDKLAQFQDTRLIFEAQIKNFTLSIQAAEKLSQFVQPLYSVFAENPWLYEKEQEREDKISLQQKLVLLITQSSQTLKLSVEKISHELAGNNSDVTQIQQKIAEIIAQPLFIKNPQAIEELSKALQDLRQMCYRSFNNFNEDQVEIVFVALQEQEDMLANLTFVKNNNFSLINPELILPNELLSKNNGNFMTRAVTALVALSQAVSDKKDQQSKKEKIRVAREKYVLPTLNKLIFGQFHKRKFNALLAPIQETNLKDPIAHKKALEVAFLEAAKKSLKIWWDKEINRPLKRTGWTKEDRPQTSATSEDAYYATLVGLNKEAKEVFEKNGTGKMMADVVLKQLEAVVVDEEGNAQIEYPFPKEENYSVLLTRTTTNKNGEVVYSYKKVLVHRAALFPQNDEDTNTPTADASTIIQSELNSDEKWKTLNLEEFEKYNNNRLSRRPTTKNPLSKMRSLFSSKEEIYTHSAYTNLDDPHHAHLVVSYSTLGEKEEKTQTSQAIQSLLRRVVNPYTTNAALLVHFDLDKEQGCRQIGFGVHHTRIDGATAKKVLPEQVTKAVNNPLLVEKTRSSNEEVQSNKTNPEFDGKNLDSEQLPTIAEFAIEDTEPYFLENCDSFFNFFKTYSAVVSSHTLQGYITMLGLQTNAYHFLEKTEYGLVPAVQIASPEVLQAFQKSKAELEANPEESLKEFAQVLSENRVNVNLRKAVKNGNQVSIVSDLSEIAGSNMLLRTALQGAGESVLGIPEILRFLGGKETPMISNIAPTRKVTKEKNRNIPMAQQEGFCTAGSGNYPGCTIGIYENQDSKNIISIRTDKNTPQKIIDALENDCEDLKNATKKIMEYFTTMRKIIESNPTLAYTILG